MGEEVLELSVDETQALRAKLGLPPLRGVGASSAAARSGEETGREELVLSVDATNDLRRELGLAPLRTSGAADGPAAGSSSSNAVHAPPPADPKGENEGARRRIEDASAKREAKDRLKQWEDENKDEAKGAGSSALDFAARMRAGAGDEGAAAAGDAGSSTNEKMNKSKKKKKKNKKSLAFSRLALPGDDEEEGGDGAPSQYTSADLQGLRVSHAASEFQVGATAVLTLTDQSILDIDPDSKKAQGLADGDEAELVNADMDRDAQARENLLKKRQIEMGEGRAGGYAGFDDDEFAVGPMDAFGNGTTGKNVSGVGAERGRTGGFAIGDAVDDDEEKKKKSDLFSGILGGAVSLENHNGKRFASDFATHEEEELERGQKEAEKEKKRQVKMLAKMRKKDKKDKKKKRKHRKRTADDDDDEEDENEGQQQPALGKDADETAGKNDTGGSLMESLEASAVSDVAGLGGKKKKRRREGADTAMDVDDKDESKSGAATTQNKTDEDKDGAMDDAVKDVGDDDDVQMLKRKREKFERVMEKGKARTEAAFGASAQLTSSSADRATADDGDDEGDDDAFLNAALAKARRLRRLKELNGGGAKTRASGDGSGKGADAAVARAVASLKESEAAKTEEGGGTEKASGKVGITFEFDEVQEFTRALRARAEQAKRAPAKAAAAGVAVGVTSGGEKKRSEGESTEAAKDEEDVVVEDVNMEELVNEMPEDDNEGNDNEEDGFGATGESAPVGRGMSSFLSLLKRTGEISGKNAGREEMRGRAKDKRTYEDYDNLDLKNVVKIDARHEKDREFANREIKLEYRDEFGRLLTRKEAYRDMCYQFHGHGSSKKNQERRLKQISREQEEGNLASRQVMSEGGVGTLGALKATQKATGKAFIIHKT